MKINYTQQDLVPIPAISSKAWCIYDVIENKCIDGKNKNNVKYFFNSIFINKRQEKLLH